MVTSVKPLNIAPPNLPLAPKQYSVQYHEQFNNILRLFFNTIANSINSEQSNEAITYYTAYNVTEIAGGAVTGDVTNTQVMLDGKIYHVVEAATTPGYNIEFDFQGVLQTPTDIVLRLWYNGSATHDVEVQLFNYFTLVYDSIHEILTELNYQIHLIPMPSFVNYISNGSVKLRLNHVSTGNPSHEVSIDYVAVRASL